ncbi:Proteasome A-type subunit [Ostreococcus tauri]|jgi:20S proteasome subunit alpha 7|uniref:Proteasome subunit alpha type n=1 Tax=Ostreococcus tauri TaxID=70448 RepID=A0A090M9S1_OSTTA|nr:Proteasome A-type subunit [Ostreococcus tauri]CEF99472.1 Proteasome A-type subunit [Ostreococcus tauri]|eukprot:XP_003081755.2 Proteasome A-type subunit [Ostreococcus tauri]
MSGIGSGYDLSTTTYSPDGRVFQVEYAGKAVDAGGLTVGVKCVDGVVIACEKLVPSKLHKPGTNRRTRAVARHAGVGGSGYTPDLAAVADRARAECANYKSFYGDAIPGKVLAERMAHYYHLFTLYWSVRPFGCSTLLGCKDFDGYHLYLVEQNGECAKMRGACIGKGKNAAKTEVEKLKLNEITCAEAVKELARIVYATHDVKDKEFECEMSWVCDASDGEFVRVPEDIAEPAREAARVAAQGDAMES